MFEALLPMRGNKAMIMSVSRSALVLIAGAIVAALQRLCNGSFAGSAKNVVSMDVRITISRNRLANIDIIKNGSSPVGAKGVKPVIQRIIDAQSTRVDAIAGATETGTILMNAVEDAVKKSYAARDTITPGANQ
jgi:fumarate reductase flavoprotein subunit